MIHTAAERPDLQDRVDPEAIWPEYNRHGDVLNAHWGPALDGHPEFQFVLVDEQEEVLAEGHTAPVPWDGTVEGLPRGIDGAVEAAAARAGADALCALAAEILPEHRGKRLAATLLEAMKELAARHGIADVIAPVRPSWKERYPLAPIERYMRWTRPDGRPFDPWLRVHVQVGGELLAAEPRSMLITGSVAEWESWTGLALPESGRYVFPHGLAPLEVDAERDRCEYWEPNVWFRHRVAG